MKGIRYSGGIAGLGGGIISNCYNEASVSSKGGYGAGGIVGRASNNLQINNCVNAGTLSGNSTGEIYALKEYSSSVVTINNCYSVDASGNCYAVTNGINRDANPLSAEAVLAELNSWVSTNSTESIVYKTWQSEGNYLRFAD